MKPLHTYLFVISLIGATALYAQEPTTTAETEQQVTATDTLPPGEKYGLRVGTDLNKLLLTAIQDEYTGFEINGDYRFYKDFYLAAEIGNEKLLREEENIVGEGSGSYVRIGVDYNAYDNWYGMQNSIYVGVRYGFATFSQRLDEYAVFTGTNYYGPTRITVPIEEKGLTAGWGELVLGIKVELFANIYLGANVSIRGMINETSPEQFDNLFIPGFGKTNDFSNFGVGYGYSISYLIPFYKKKN
ncbi:DUF6048 family protein [Aquimarina intermedia]|uniref:Outer membrane protein with beta-barrel domain n=1 Tax=Aquimarina intermedia TaxID=350814 RepID=A0A5S5BUC3_9FLAO|nr:DUF6048 family protein [Aquimarina intermedia]TYP69938.1 hypothetical protein BD809_1152 [Aquimarina intermedia]